MSKKPCRLEEIDGCNHVRDVGSLCGCEVAGEAAVGIYGVENWETKQCYCYQ